MDGVDGGVFEQLLFNKVDFRASDFEAAVGLQVEAAGKMKVAVGVLDHRTIQNCFALKNFFVLTTPTNHPNHHNHLNHLTTLTTRSTKTTTATLTTRGRQIF